MSQIDSDNSFSKQQGTCTWHIVELIFLIPLIVTLKLLNNIFFLKTAKMSALV